MNDTGILLVDDETLALKYFTRAFGDRFRVIPAHSAAEAMNILDREGSAIGVVLTDQRMPEATGVELLKAVRDRHPYTVRLLTTAYTEPEVLVDAINTGAVFSFIPKPWEMDALEGTLRDAIARHRDHLRNATLLDTRMADLKRQVIEDHAIQVGLIAARLGHYVHNALCPLTCLVDQLADSRIASGLFPPRFLESLREHIFEVSGTLQNLEESSVAPDPATFEPVDIPSLIREAAAASEPLREAGRMKVDLTGVNDPLPSVFGNRQKLRQIFQFLIAEQVVSLPPDSTIAIRCVRGMDAHGAEGLKIDVEDFVPIPKNLSPRDLLHPFNLRGQNQREFGVFLASCYFLARHHGGSLDARTKIGEGVVYHLFLPFHPGHDPVTRTSSGAPSRSRPQAPFFSL